MITLLINLERSGFVWEDVDYRFLAFTDDQTYFAFAATPEAAVADLAEVLQGAVS